MLLLYNTLLSHKERRGYMRRVFIFFLVILGLAMPAYLTSSSVNIRTHSPKAGFSYVAPALDKSVNILLRCPYVRDLLSEIQKDGPIYLDFKPLGKNAANAMWQSNTRYIVVNSSNKRGIPDTVRSILFEMHNAHKQKAFAKIDEKASHKQLSKEMYVQAIEHQEHQNALQTKNVIDWGIRNNFFPKESEWPIFTNFEDHYKLQQLSGHSDFIAHVYDILNPQGKHTSYRGTLVLTHLTDHEKKVYMNFLALKNTIEHGSPKEKEQARQVLMQTYANMHFHQGQELALLHDTFQSSPIYNNLFGPHYA